VEDIDFWVNFVAENSKKLQKLGLKGKISWALNNVFTLPNLEIFQFWKYEEERMCSHLRQCHRLHEYLGLKGDLMCLFCLQGEWANCPLGACPLILGQDNLVYAHCDLISASGTCLPYTLKTWHNIQAHVLPCREAISLQRGLVLFAFLEAPGLWGEQAPMLVPW
jgi:hypothetical protein